MNRPDPTDVLLARLAKAETLSAEVQRIAGVGTWWFDTASGIVFWSEEMFRMYGVSPTTFEPSFESFMSCVHADDREMVLRVIEETIGGTPMDLIHRIVWPDGEVRHTHGRAQVVVLEKNGAPVLVGTAQDITERRRAEETIAAQSRQLIEMQSELIYVARQSAMGTMAATLAHELNQPLAAITNYAAGLKRLMASSAQATAGLEQIEKNTERAGEIIRHLRDMTRRGETHHARTGLAEIIKGALVLVSKGACAENQIECRIDERCFVEADPIQIGQVIINLVKNACEAVQEQQTKRIIIETEQQDDLVRVSVTDTGPGIPPDIMPTLFDGRNSSKPDGMGIGLSISRTIIESHGGDIEAENPRQGGACFWFTLPRAKTTKST